MNKVARKPKTNSVEEYDRRFDDGEDMSAHVDWSKMVHIEAPSARVELDLPSNFHTRLAAEAGRRGVMLDDLIKMWLADKLDEYRRPAP